MEERGCAKDAPTGVALITVDAAGETTIVVAPGANAELRPEDLSFDGADGGALPAGDPCGDGRARGRARAALLPQRRARARRRPGGRADDRQPARARGARRAPRARLPHARRRRSRPARGRRGGRARRSRRPSRPSTAPARATRSPPASSSRSSRAATARRRSPRVRRRRAAQHRALGAQSSLPTAEEVDATACEQRKSSSTATPATTTRWRSSSRSPRRRSSSSASRPSPGNQTLDKTTRNALVTLEIAGRTDIPVAAGADAPLDAHAAHGGARARGDRPRRPGAARAVARLRSRGRLRAEWFEPGVVLVPTGPLTNVARWIEHGVAIERIVWMGGAIAEGNVTPAAEFNAFVDPEAAARGVRERDPDHDDRPRRHAQGALHAVRTPTACATRAAPDASSRSSRTSSSSSTGSATASTARRSTTRWPSRTSSTRRSSRRVNCNVEIETQSEFCDGRTVVDRWLVTRCAEERRCRDRRRRGALPRAARLADSLAGVSLVFACIAPHGDVDLDPALRPAMEELGRRAAAAQPDVAVVVTPHSVHVEGHFAVVTSGKVGEYETDARRGTALLEADLPILSVSYGSNYPASSRSSRSTGEPRSRSSSCARRRSSSSRPRATGRSRSTSGSARRSPRCRGASRSSRAPTTATRTPRTASTATTRRQPRYDALLQEILASDRLDFLPARRVRRGRRRPTRSGSSSFCRERWGRPRERTFSRTRRRRTTACSSRRFRRRRRSATRPARP